MGKGMFKTTKETLDKYSAILDRFEEEYHSDTSKWVEDASWLDNHFSFDLAKALYYEVPNIGKIAKMICVMEETQ